MAVNTFTSNSCNSSLSSHGLSLFHCYNKKPGAADFRTVNVEHQKHSSSFGSHVVKSTNEHPFILLSSANTRQIIPTVVTIVHNYTKLCIRLNAFNICPQYVLTELAILLLGAIIFWPHFFLKFCTISNTWESHVKKEEETNEII